MDEKKIENAEKPSNEECYGRTFFFKKAIDSKSVSRKVHREKINLNFMHAI